MKQPNRLHLIILGLVLLTAFTASIVGPRIYKGLQDFTGATVWGTERATFYPETYGAVGNGSTDDTTALNNALTAAGAVGGRVLLRGVTYATTAAVVIPNSFVTLEGNTQRSATISSSSTTADIVTVTSDTGANCSGNAVSGWGVTIKGLTLKRNTGATQGKGINYTNTCLGHVENVDLIDNVSNLYVSGSAHLSTERVYVDFNTSTSTTAYGVEVDSSSNANNSTYLDYVVVSCSGSNKRGLYIHGASIADMFGTRFETAACAYGAYVVSTTNPGTYDIANQDVKLDSFVIDQIKVAGVHIEDVYGGGVPNVHVRDCYATSDDDSAIGVEIVNAKGVEVSHCEMRFRGASTIAVKASGANSSDIRILGNKFDVTKTSVQSAAPRTIVSNNTFTAITSLAATTYISFLSGATDGTITGNTMGGYATNGIVFASGANGNVRCGNKITAANITNSVVDGGTSNTNCDVSLVASGAKALATASISSGACTSAQTDTATGALTTDAVSVTFSADPTGTTGYAPTTDGMLTIVPYITANTVNFKVCNNTSSSISPGAVTLNWRIVR